MGCSECHGYGWIIHREGDGHEVAAPCPRCSNGPDRLSFAFAAAGIPEKWRGARFSSFDLGHYTGGDARRTAANALAKARKWVEQYGADVTRGLLFVGPPGGGKSLLAHAVAAELVVKGIQVKAAGFSSLLLDVRETFGGGSEETEGRILGPLVEVPVLVLDDLGAGSVSDFAARVAFDLIEGRLIRELPTIVTTNLGEAALKDTLGERVSSRLLEACAPISMAGLGDFRRRFVGASCG